MSVEIERKQTQLESLLGGTQAQNELALNGHVTLGALFDADDFQRQLPNGLNHVVIGMDSWGENPVIHRLVYDSKRIKVERVTVTDDVDKDRQAEILRSAGYRVLLDLETEVIGYTKIAA